MFKAACPRSYCYAYDDATSTFTCTEADYTVTFCPSSPSQKSSRDSTPATTGSTSQRPDTEPGLTYSGNGYGYPGSGSSSGSGSGQTVMTDGSWLAGLAMGDSPRTTASPSFLPFGAVMASTTISVMFSFV